MSSQIITVVWYILKNASRFVYNAKMGSPTLYLIRHGDFVKPLDELGEILVHGPDVSLSPEGIRQIRHVAQLIKKTRSLDEIHSSPYPRALQTAGIIAKMHGLDKIMVNSILCDRYIPGWWGVPKNQHSEIAGNTDSMILPVKPEMLYGITQRTKDLYYKTISELSENGIQILTDGASPDDWILRSGQETTHDVFERIKHIPPVILRNETKSTGIVSHGDPIALLYYYLKHPRGEVPQINKLIQEDTYPAKGEAIRVSINDQGRMVEGGFVGQEAGIKRERIY